MLFEAEPIWVKLSGLIKGTVQRNIVRGLGKKVDLFGNQVQCSFYQGQKLHYRESQSKISQYDSILILAHSRTPLRLRGPW